MKNRIYLLLIMTMGLYSCVSQKVLETKAVFSVASASCQEWVGGKEESGSGYTLSMPVELAASDKVVFKNVFFRGHELASKLKEEEGKMVLVCKYNTLQSANNQSPSLEKENALPFELKADEAVISYSEEGKNKLKYMKVTGIKNKPARIYPSKAQN